ncbi:hypothetical protein [Paracoccus shanxieyensis]|uniref:hypothetical protein n=1 Tax=Paracoccus shanxieyensis TaxID=2675752 RepID=UPI0018ACA69E|nr:hypothetical protein [Paracoccus shanxieyensis]
MVEDLAGRFDVTQQTIRRDNGRGELAGPSGAALREGAVNLGDGSRHRMTAEGQGRHRCRLPPAEQRRIILPLPVRRLPLIRLALQWLIDGRGG